MLGSLIFEVAREALQTIHPLEKLRRHDGPLHRLAWVPGVLPFLDLEGGRVYSVVERRLDAIQVLAKPLRLFLL